MGSPHGLAPPDPAPVVPEQVTEPVAEPVAEVDDEEDVPVTRSAALIEEALNAILTPTPSVTVKKA